jgi:3-(3-hydroxy-phenyl)propionate hydroxylase
MSKPVVITTGKGANNVPTIDKTSEYFDTDIVIVGYGPTGVAAANFLGAYGVNTMVFERDHGIYQRARAVTVNDWTLRCFQSVGLDQKLLADMDPTTALRWRTYAGKELMRVKLSSSTIGQPPSMMIYQPVMEQTLRDGAARFSDRLHVHFGREVTEVEQNESGVSVSTKDLVTGEVTSVRARYILACDGGASGVRTQLGIGLIGSTLDTKWVVIDAKVKQWWPERHLLTFWADAKRPVVDIPLALGNHRWEFPLEPHESESDFETPEQLWRLLATMGITEQQVELRQHAFYRHHLRHAQRWREGRVFLLGDAAHMMPPWAGQGMQSGIRDAFNLSWKLREVLARRIPESILNTYEPERAPNVAMITQMSEQMGRIIKMQMTGKEKLQGFIGSTLSKLKLPLPPSPLGRAPSLTTGWLRGTPAKESAVGKMIPQPKVATAGGKQGFLDDILGTGFVILGAEIDPSTLLNTSERAGWDALDTRYLAIRSGNQGALTDQDVVDLDGVLLAWMKQHRTEAVALRPDRFVAAAQGSGLQVP